jgi:hypothetical protein
MGGARAELSQAIASPRVLVGSLRGFTLNHLRTAAEAAIVQLAFFRLRVCVTECGALPVCYR